MSMIPCERAVVHALFAVADAGGLTLRDGDVRCWEDAPDSRDRSGNHARGGGRYNRIYFHEVQSTDIDVPPP